MVHETTWNDMKQHETTWKWKKHLNSFQWSLLNVQIKATKTTGVDEMVSWGTACKYHLRFMTQLLGFGVANQQALVSVFNDVATEILPVALNDSAGWRCQGQ